MSRAWPMSLWRTLAAPGPRIWLIALWLSGCSPYDPLENIEINCAGSWGSGYEWEEECPGIWGCDDGTDNDDDDDDDDTWASRRGVIAELLIQVGPGVILDDPIGDDDDSAAIFPPGMLPTMQSPVTLEWTLSHYDDARVGEPRCQQYITAEGSLRIGVGVLADCEACTGALTLDPSSVVDVGDPEDPWRCDPALLQAQGEDLSLSLLAPPEWGGSGELLQIGLIDLQTATLIGSRLDGEDIEEVAGETAPPGRWSHSMLLRQDDYGAGRVGDLTYIGGFSGAEGWVATGLIEATPSNDYSDRFTLSGGYQSWSPLWFILP